MRCVLRSNSGPQLLGYHLSLRIGLNPDNRAGRVINRVVSGVRIYPQGALETQENK